MPLILVLQSILGVIQLLEVFRLPYYPTINRVTRLKYFQVDQNLVLPLLLLLGIWLIIVLLQQYRKYSFVPLISFIFIPIYGLEASLAIASLISVVITIFTYRDFKEYLLWSLLIVSVINILSILHWLIITPLNGKTPLVSIALLELDIFYIASYLAPLIILPLFFIWFIKHMLNLGWKPQLVNKIYNSRDVPKKYIWILFASALILSFISAVYPYLPNVNPNMLNVGVDIDSYVKWAKIVDRDIYQALNVSGGSRPLIHLVIISFKHLSGLNYISAVTFLPILLNPLFVISVYFLTYEAFQDPIKASWASFFTASGYQITVNMYSYFLANILGLSLIFFSLGFLFRTLRERKRDSLIAASILGALLVFTHPWTFDQYYSVIFVLTAAYLYSHWKRRKGQTNLKPMILYLTIITIAELVKSLILRGFGGISATSTAVNRFVWFNEFWFSSIYSFRLLYGGFLSNILLLGLAVIGAYLLGFEETNERFLNIMLAVTALIFIIGNETIKSRLLFNIPIGIYASIGFLHIFELIQDKKIRFSFITLTISSMLVYFFQSLSNLV